MTNQATLSNFTQYSEKFRPLIDKNIDENLSLVSSDKRLKLVEAMRYCILNKGKRVRPLLTLATNSLFSDDPSHILPMASAIEMIHTYSLIHDDLPAMDDDDFRRGQPTCHKKYGEDMAILAGDALLTIAFEIISSRLNSNFEANSILKAIHYLSLHCGTSGLIGGQVLDIKNDSASNEDELEQIHNLKTGALIKSAIVIPAILHQADESDIEALELFGKELGLLFQIVDDILDVTASSETLGKTAKKDIDQDKMTYVSIYGLEESISLAKDLSDQCRSALGKVNYKGKNTLEAFVDFFSLRTY